MRCAPACGAPAWASRGVRDFVRGSVEAVALRAGINIANNPIPSQFMNPLFPAIESFSIAMIFRAPAVSEVENPNDGYSDSRSLGMPHTKFA